MEMESGEVSVYPVVFKLSLYSLLIRPWIIYQNYGTSVIQRQGLSIKFKATSDEKTSQTLYENSA